MLRIHLTSADLARVRITPSIGPLAEALLALSVLQQRRSPGLFTPWHGQLRLRVPVLPPVVRDIAPLYAATDPVLDLLTPVGVHLSVEEEVQAILAAPPDQLAAEVAFVGGVRTIPGWAADLGARSGDGRCRFVRAALAAHATLVAPYWAEMRAYLDSERSTLGRYLLDGGLNAALPRLNASIVWNAPVLEVDMPPYLPGAPDTWDYHLAGEGLDITPSVFCREPQFYTAPGRDKPARLVYPAVRDLSGARALWTGAGPDRRALGQLLGTTRAAVLSTIAARPGITSNELARANRLSPASASEHATALRESGLIVTRRDGRFRLHQLTMNGRALLDGPSSTRRPGQAKGLVST